MHQEQQYLDLLQKILDEGYERNDRTGVGTKALFGAQMRFDLSKSFPLLTTKRVWFKGVVHELIWLLSGNTNIQYLLDNDVHIWDAWADDKGNLGPVYGKQWRGWEVTYQQLHIHKSPVARIKIDQISKVIESIKNDPYSRRHIVSAWNVGEISQMALPPCHTFFQFFVRDGKLDCQLYQRSVDTFLGAPFNIASYSLLTCMIAQLTNLEPGEFVHTLGDYHIYNNHVNQVKEQLSRTPYDFPILELNKDISNIDDFKFEDIKVVNYKSHPTIKAPIAV